MKTPSLKVALLVLALAYFVDWLSVVTWTLWAIETAFGISDHCYFMNPWLVKLFGMIEDRDLNRNVKVPSIVMPEIDAKDYSFEALAVLSQNWKQPVVVRGLFRNASALAKWQEVDYLLNVFGTNATSVVQNGTLTHTYERICSNQLGINFTFPFSKEQPFDETMRRIMSGASSETIVFPPASRSKRLRNAPLEAAFNRMVDTDLDLRRIGGTFSTGIVNTALTQMFVGLGAPEGSNEPVRGTGWHGDICNNFVVQIAGIKKWIMVDPIYSAYMRPTMNNGKTAICGGHRTLDDNLPHFPHYVVDLHPGDFLYNPEWYWHSIENHPNGPYSFGLISRQCHLVRNFKSNALFTTMILVNHAIAGIYDPEARQRIWSAITGSTLMKPEDAVFVTKDKESGGYFSK